MKEAERAATRAARMAAAAASNLVASSFHSSGMSSGNDDSDANNAATTATTAATVGSSTTTATTKSSLLLFPRMAKFIETVTPPDFTSVLRDGRMYEEEVPKAKDESDEDEPTAYQSSNLEGIGNGGDSMNNNKSTRNQAKNKKRRWRRYDPRPRRWVLQEKSEFFDKIRKRRMRSSGSVASGDNNNDDEEDSNGISNQYHGVVEANASKYVILSVAPASSSVATTAASTTDEDHINGMILPSEKIYVQPIYGFHTFSQPYKFASLSMEEAEHAIEKQREVMSRYMMHGRMALRNSSNEAAAALKAGVVTSTGGVGIMRGRGLSRSIGPPPKAMSRARLLGKLTSSGVGRGSGGRGVGEDEDDGDDIMGDVRYSSSMVGGTSKGRKELLSSLGDEGVTADDDGVLGGTNDSEFGGRRKFARVSTAKDDANASQGAKGGGGRNVTSTGFEAAAMEEGFYQRDVAAEYEALDYDVEEQFDDDDVNVGEDEMMDDGGGYGGDYNDSGDENLLDSDDEDAGSGSDNEALTGMATASGLKAMLAKARGESPVTTSGFDSTNSSVAGTGTSALDTSFENLSGGFSGTESTASLSGMGGMIKKKPASPSVLASAVVEMDKDGKRLITLEAVRREIWLNNGAITSKRLTKKFDVTKKNPERQALFKTIIMELCTIKKDADGNKLVLKQHYSKI